MSTRNWKKSKIYCRSCKRWKNDIKHCHCPRGEKGSLTWVDIENLEMGCNKCNRTWTLESNKLHCSCGNVQRTQYVDTVVALEEGDQVIATDGDMIYVLTRSGVVVVGYRSFPDIGY